MQDLFIRAKEESGGNVKIYRRVASRNIKKIRNEEEWNRKMSDLRISLLEEYNTGKKKRSLSNEDAEIIGDLLGFVPAVAKYKARRFYSYLKGEVKNWSYDDFIMWGDVRNRIAPVIMYLQRNDYML